MQIRPDPRDMVDSCGQAPQKKPVARRLQLKTSRDLVMMEPVLSAAIA